MKQKLILAPLSLLLFMILIVGCQNHARSDAPAAVESYLKAMIGQDADTLSALSCSDWEAQARLELDSFAGVKASLKDPGCKVTGNEGDATLVICSGSIIANYNGEDQDLSLAKRTFLVKQDAGDWRVCGYR